VPRLASLTRLWVFQKWPPSTALRTAASIPHCAQSPAAPMIASATLCPLPGCPPCATHCSACRPCPPLASMLRPRPLSRIVNSPLLRLSCQRCSRMPLLTWHWWAAARLASSWLRSWRSGASVWRSLVGCRGRRAGAQIPLPAGGMCPGRRGYFMTLRAAGLCLPRGHRQRGAARAVAWPMSLSTGPRTPCLCASGARPAGLGPSQ
jgi:hypothetical protein